MATDCPAREPARVCEPAERRSGPLRGSGPSPAVTRVRGESPPAPDRPRWTRSDAAPCGAVEPGPAGLQAAVWRGLFILKGWRGGSSRGPDALGRSSKACAALGPTIGRTHLDGHRRPPEPVRTVPAARHGASAPLAGSQGAPASLAAPVGHGARRAVAPHPTGPCAGPRVRKRTPAAAFKVRMGTDRTAPRRPNPGRHRPRGGRTAARYPCASASAASRKNTRCSEKIRRMLWSSSWW